MREGINSSKSAYTYGALSSQADDAKSADIHSDAIVTQEPTWRSFVLKLFASLLCIAALVSIILYFLLRSNPVGAPPRTDDHLVFYDDFDFLDSDRWTIEKSLFGGGNWEFQYYTNNSANIFTKDSVLHLRPGYFIDLPPMKTVPGSDTLYSAEDVMLGNCEPYPACATFVVPDCTEPRFKGCKRVANKTEGSIINPITSARINSKDKFQFRYGRVEWKAKLPKGDWLWPALWLLPLEDTYGPWPASGEIDVMESRGNNKSYRNNGEPAGYDVFGSTLHYGQIETTTATNNNNGAATTTIVADGWANAHKDIRARDIRHNWKDFTTHWCIFGLVWTKDQMYTYVRREGDDTEHIVLDLKNGFGRGFYYPPLGNAGKPGWRHNPYRGEAINAPFDQSFYLIMNLAVGGHAGNLGYWDNAPWGTCNPPTCSKETTFWQARDQWMPSWQEAGENNAFLIDWVKIWQ